MSVINLYCRISFKSILKKMKIKSIAIILIVTIGLSFSSCKKSVSNNDSKNNFEITLDKNLLQRSNRYAELIAKRGTEKIKFSIEDIKRQGNNLLITVKGGYKE